MPSSDAVTAWVAGGQLLVGAIGIGAIFGQVRGERRAQQFDVYNKVSMTYMDHLWRAAEDPQLNEIWEPWAADDKRRRELGQAQAGQGAAAATWGAWYAMNDSERYAYRYTRAALEIFEQAWHLYDTKIIDATTWEQKWEPWIRIWTNTRYFAFVFADTRPRLIKDFCTIVSEIKPTVPDVADPPQGDFRGAPTQVPGSGRT
jgi:hypothetical protein